MVQLSYTGSCSGNACYHLVQNRLFPSSLPTDIKIKTYQAIKYLVVLCSRNNQHCALICTTPLLYILALTCFGSGLPSSGSFLDPSELLEIQIEYVVYHVMCGYVACVPECQGVPFLNIIKCCL
jgi:hypothetical protein